jgi:hypothetical protein
MAAPCEPAATAATSRDARDRIECRPRQVKALTTAITHDSNEEGSTRTMMNTHARLWRWGAAAIGLSLLMVCVAMTTASSGMAVQQPGVAGSWHDDTDGDANGDERKGDTDPDENGDDERDTGEDADAPAADAPPARVIVRIGRNEEVRGNLKLLDDSVIVIETRRGEILSYPLLRILDVIQLVEPEPDQKGMVLLRDGQSREGVIIEDTFEHVILEVQGIRTRLPREIVDRVILKPTFQQQYEQFVSTLDPAMPDRTILFCRWLMDQRRYDLARDHLRNLLDEETGVHDLAEARRLLRIAEAHLAMQRNDQPEQARQAENPVEALPDSDSDEVLEQFPGGLLTREQVNLIRVFEIDFRNPPRVSVKPETIRRLVSDFATHPSMPAAQRDRNKLFRAEPLDIVKLMFELRARDQYGEVQVQTEPHALNIFRRSVHDNWLLQNCASCHSGPDAGRFFLHRRGYQDERVRYTNFLILERLEIDPKWPLVNYDNPEMSLIIQYAMPRNEARLPHPEVPGWEPVFTRSRQRLKQQSIRWIESMMQPRPDYPVDYQPPTAAIQSAGDDDNDAPSRQER